MELWKNIVPSENKFYFIRQKKNEAMNEDWKTQLRRGVPLNKGRAVILSIFGISNKDFSSDYASKKKFAFKGEDPVAFRHFPTFSQKDFVECLIPHHCLNQIGIREIKKLLWVIKQTESKLNYAPLMLPIVGFQSIHCNEAETHHIIETLIKVSYDLLDEESQYNRAEELRGLRWYLPMDEEEFTKTCKSFLNLMSQKSKSVKEGIKKLEKLEINVMKFIQNMFGNFFLKILPFDVISFFSSKIIKIYIYRYAIICFFLIRMKA